MTAMKKKLNFAVDVVMHRQLKIIAAMNGVSVAEIARTALATAIQPMPLDTPADQRIRRSAPSPLAAR